MQNDRFYLGSTNAAEGEAWVEAYCETCYRDKNRCSILMRAEAGLDTPELVYDKNGDPICKKYVNKYDWVVKHREDKNQLNIFD